MYEPLTLTSSDRISDGKDFKVADLTLPGEISVEALQARHSFLNLVDERYRRMEAAANFGMVDAFDERALSLITSPTVRKAFDVSLESTKTKETYGTGPLRTGSPAGPPAGRGGLPVRDRRRLEPRRRTQLGTPTTRTTTT